MDQLVLSYLFHKVLLELEIFSVHLNPGLSEFFKVFSLLFTDNMLLPNLALIDALSDNGSEFLLKFDHIVCRQSSGGDCILRFSGEIDIVIVQLSHVLGVIFELLGLEKVPSKHRRGVIKSDKIVDTPRESLLL